MSDPFKNPPLPTPEYLARVAEFDKEQAEWDAMSESEQVAHIQASITEELARVPTLVENITSAYGTDAFYKVTSQIRALVNALEKQELRRNRIYLKYVPLPHEGVAFWAVVYHPAHAHVDGHRWWDRGGTVLATFATRHEAFDMTLRCASRMQADPCFDGTEAEEPVYFTVPGEQDAKVYRGTLAHVGCLLGVQQGARVLDTNDPRISMDVRHCFITVGSHLPQDDEGHRVGRWGLSYNPETGVETWPIEDAPMWWLEPWGQDPAWVAPSPSTPIENQSKVA